MPLLERLRYLTIVSSNLDELFEIRVAELVEIAQSGLPDSAATQESLLAIHRRARALVERHPATLHMTAFGPEETPRSLQLYTVDPDMTYAGARMIVDDDLAALIKELEEACDKFEESKARKLERDARLAEKRAAKAALAGAAS